MNQLEPVRLTQFSSGAGCGCKISPQVLDEILAGGGDGTPDPRLLVGNDTRDDAAALLLDDGDSVLLSTTDFFMPIVDDPFDFGRIASANAISDIYAMGGRPSLALAVLGWPIQKLAPEIARDVIRGARAVCAEAAITLAGGHSIDSPEPIFGLAVSGIVPKSRLKTNEGALPGDLLYLTKPLGVGILATAEKRSVLRDEDIGKAAESMTRLNSAGAELAALQCVNALTDVTGFGLFGHLLEMCRAGNVRARIDFEAVPQLGDLNQYLEQGVAPGGTHRNWASYGDAIDCPDETRRLILSDPQTSGGLLVAVNPDDQSEAEDLFDRLDLAIRPRPIGTILEAGEGALVSVS